MIKPSWKFLKLSPLVFAATFFAANSAIAGEVNQSETSVSQLSQESNNIGQVTSVSQFSDVQPTDWAFQALQSLVERYGCIAGYPNGTYRGNRALTRYEFAAGLNACLDRVNELIATATADLIRKEDLATLQRLQEEFSAELATLRGRVDALEARTAELEADQFSTTTKLTGEVIFAVSDVLTGRRALPLGLERSDLAGIDLTTFPGGASNQTQAQIVVDRIIGQQANIAVGATGLTAAQVAALPADVQQARLRTAAYIAAYGAGTLRDARDRDTTSNIVLADRVRLNFDSSFSGTDRLRVRVQARNNVPYSTSTTGTDMTRLGFDGNDNNVFQIDDLYYQFNLSDKLRVQIAAAQTEFNDSLEVFSPAFASSSSGAISRFGRFSPIYRTADSAAGVSLIFGPNSPISLSVAYLVPTANNPGLGTGIINGGYSAIGQLTFRPSPAFNVGLTYARTYQNSESGVNVFGSTGSFLANRPFGNFATTANHYGVEAVLRPSSKFTVSGFGGYSQIDAEEGPFENGDAEALYWAGSIAFTDFGREGNTLGFIFGQPPKITESDVGAEDQDTSYHLEALYRLRLTNNIAVTPGVIVIFNPEHNSNNDNIYVGTIRTTFTF